MENKDIVSELKKLKETTVKDLRKLNEKATLTPADYDAAKTAVELVNKISQTCAMLEWDDEEEKSADVSGYRGRSMHTGRYVSMGVDYPHSGSYGYHRYMTGTSGHSIEDRMIACLEGMFDEANSDYERSQIDRVIHMIRP